MGVKFDKTDDLGKMFEEFAFDPLGDELEKREKANQAEAEKFLQSERKAAKIKKENTEK